MELTIGADSVRRVHWEGAVLALLAVVVAVFCGHALAQVEQEWAARYNGPGNSTDHATAMAVGAAGNVYVTGDSVGLDASADYATVKYDASGNELWAARYSGPGNSTDRAEAIAVDGAGNVYVTGDSVGLDASADYATVKYDADGNELWVARYSGPNNSIDRAAAIAVDAAGNVYVTGDSDGSDPPVDFLTVKYDADGNELWVARYNNSAGKPRGGAGFIALDESGNVYVSGSSLGAYGYPSGYAMVKYDGSGNELWVARLEYFGSGSSAIALDAAGNVYPKLSDSF